MTLRPGVTPARHRALEAMAVAYPACARESNATSVGLGYVYWQSGRWLVANELAYYPSGSTMLMLTTAGVELCKAIGVWERR